MILNNNTLNEVNINAGDGVGYSFQIEDLEPGLSSNLLNWNCPTSIPGNSDFYIGNYDIHQSPNGLSSWTFITNNFFENSNFNNETYKINGNDGIGFNSNKIRGKTINFTLFIAGTTEENFKNKLDEVLSQVSLERNCLIKKINGEYRKIRVIPSSNPYSLKNFNKTFCELEVELLAVDPYWFDFNETIALNGSSVNMNGFYSFSQLGFTKTENVILELEILTSNLTSLKITLNEDEFFEYKGTVGANDIIEFDYYNKILKINGITRRFFGTGGFLKGGSNTIRLEGTGSFIGNLSIKYFKTYN